MKITLHPHAIARLKERGATREEVIAALEKGAKAKAKFGRTVFMRNFAFDGIWKGTKYRSKKLEVVAVPVSGAGNDWLVVTVIVKFF